jgi:hypothetical protein
VGAGVRSAGGTAGTAKVVDDYAPSAFSESCLPAVGAVPRLRHALCNGIPDGGKMCTSCSGSTGRLQNQHFVELLSILSPGAQRQTNVIPGTTELFGRDDLVRVDVHMYQPYSWPEDDAIGPWADSVRRTKPASGFCGVWSRRPERDERQGESVTCARSSFSRLRAAVTFPALNSPSMCPSQNLSPLKSKTK